MPPAPDAPRRNVNTVEYWDMTHERWVREDAIPTIIKEREGAWPRVLKVIPPEGRLLDVGCSAGFFLGYLWRHRPLLSLVGLDFSAAGVAVARAAVPSASFHVGDCHEMPFPADSFDVVYSGHLLEHLADPPLALREQRRVLWPGGRVVVHFPYRDTPYVEHLHDNLDYRDVGRWLRHAGFRRVQTTSVIRGLDRGVAAVNEGVMWATK